MHPAMRIVSFIYLSDFNLSTNALLPVLAEVVIVVMVGFLIEGECFCVATDVSKEYPEYGL